MITCPECGQQAADDAKFCDHCGQGLTTGVRPSASASLIPLASGSTLAHGYRIVALLRQTSRENRYRAERTDGTACELREQAGPAGPPITHDESPANEPAAAVEDPAGPQAKTAELKLREPVTATNGGAPTAATAPPTAVAAAPAPSVAEPAATPEENASVAAAPPAGDPGAAALVVLAEPVQLEAVVAAPVDDVAPPPEDLGETFGRVQALSLTLNHPALQRAIDGFAENGRVYLAYREEPLTPLAARPGGLAMEESEALGVAIQLCQAVAFVHRRGLRVNDICPAAVALGPDGRVRLTSLDYVSNDNELQSEPVFNDGYTAPEIYRAKQADKRADIFALGAMLYSLLTGERLEAESWREEAGPVRFYPPHVVTPALEQAVRRALLFEPAARWPTVDAFKTELLRLAATCRVAAAGLTDVGMVRELNEDAVMMLEYWRDSQIDSANGFLYVIADGMGGAEAGEVASAIAVGAIREHFEHRLGAVAGDALGPLLNEALETANRKILDYQVTHPESRGMGSTGVAALVVPPVAAISWVGDSRAYLSQATGLRQLSKDHSLVQRLIEIGQITEEEARHHEHKNVITRSLGARPNGPAGAETVTVHLKRGDRLMLCSDGLTAHVTDGTIAEVLRRHRDPVAAARELIVAANAGGGTDNVSAVVIFCN